MPLNIDSYPYLESILRTVYQNRITHKKSIKGAHDSNWIKEYELFYSKQPKSTPYVTRIYFKDNVSRGKDVGFLNVRPVTDGSEISETYLKPPKTLSSENGVYIKCLDTYDIYGESVECVPFIMPETIFGMCIHASIWICLKILEKKGRMIEKALCIPEIQQLAGGSPYSDKQGLVFVQAARLLRMSRANAFYVINKEQPVLNDNQMLLELYAYVESKLPVIVGVDVADLQWWESARHGYHSIVAIGHTMENNKIDGFIFHDESAFPYQLMKNDELLNAWHVPVRSNTDPSNYVREMLVAVPPEVSLAFHEAFHEFQELLRNLSHRGVTNETIDRLVIRPMLRDSADFFIETRNTLLFRALREANFPLYIWVFLLYDVDSTRDLEHVKGFFVRDATQRTEFRFFYFKKEKKAIYQLKDRVYSIREGSTRRRRA